MYFVGIDACRQGWFAVSFSHPDDWKIAVYKTIGDFGKAFQKSALIFIDIPIGLPSAGRRMCDLQTRKILRQRASSVFAVPCREALKAKTYHSACRINQQVLGVRLSIQTWNIFPKINEIDQWLRHQKPARQRIRESHPELCFWALAGGRPMAYSKKGPQGFADRYAILEKTYPHTAAMVDLALHQFRRKGLARDDILDAIVLAVSAGCSPESIKTVPSVPPRDKKNLPMEMVYAMPEGARRYSLDGSIYRDFYFDSNQKSDGCYSGCQKNVPISGRFFCYNRLCRHPFCGTQL
jgi:predicted RNase H-like nuclease